MRNAFFISFLILSLLLLWPGIMIAQSVGNYAITRQTGITYTSISATGNSIGSWRHNNPAQVLDDNRSFPVPIGFDFWYDGARYTTMSVGINGLADFSSSVATGYTPGDYDSDNPSHTRMSNTTGYTAWDVIAPMYGDLTTQDQVDPLGTSFKYLTTGSAPNRVFTIEWINLSVWNQINTGTSWNFQIKLYESTGTFEILYGDMTAGAATLLYKTGINAPDLSGGLSSAVLMIQQTANSTDFQPQRIPGGGYVTDLPESFSKLVFTSLTPANPANLTFTNVTQTSMRLNWTDNANNEVGYVIYSSLDGVNYDYLTQLPANSNFYDASGLIPATTYYWQVYAVTEGRLSAGLSGSQSTSSATEYISRATGNWNTGGTWVGGAVPTAYSNVTIDDGHTVTINGSITVNNLTVGQGTSGILRIGNNNTARTVNVVGDITVNAGAQFIVNTGSNTSNHQLNLTGNILNNNVFNLAPDGNSRCRITFNRSGNQTVSGPGSTTRFYLMTLDMGISNSNVLDISTSDFSTQSNGFLTITNGTFKFAAPSTITPFTTSVTVPLPGGLWINNASAEVTTTGGNLSVAGFVRISSGVLNVGTAANQQLISDGGEIIIEGGLVNVAGSLNRTNDVTITQLTMTDGTLRVATIGSTSTTLSPFMMDVVGSKFNMSGGRIVIVREGGTGANDLGYLNTGTTDFTVSGGSLQIGDYSTPVGQTVLMNTIVPVFNFVDSSANVTAQLTSNNLTVSNDVFIAAGTLNANGLDITVKWNWTNQGTFIPGTGTVTFDGTLSSLITKTGGETFYNLSIDKQSALATANSNVTVNNAFTLSQGTFAVGSNVLTLNGAVSSTGGSLTSLADGTVQYNQASAGQAILVADYGNLTLNAFSKTYPAGTVGVASVLTVPNPATAHVMTGNTIIFNGSAAQTVPATTTNFVYNNVTLSNGASKSAGGAITVASALSVENAITFDGGANTITINGDIANSGSITGSGAGAVVLTGGSTTHTLSGNGAYRNITMNDVNGSTLSEKTTVNGMLTLTSGNITVSSASDTLSISTTGNISRANGHIIGNLQMYIPAGTSSRIFPLGASSLYLPVRLEFANVGTAGFITIARYTNQQHPNISDPSAPIDSTQDLKAYWKLSNSGVILTGTYNVTFAFDSTSECIGGVSPTLDFVGARWNGSNWTYIAPALRTADSTRLDALSAFGDFILGKSRALLISAIKSGLWSDPTVWNGRVPGSNDTAKIVDPFIITLDINASVAKFIIDASSTFKDSTFALTVTGDFILNGTWIGEGKISLTTANDSLFGSGSMTGTGILEIAGNKALSATSSLTLKNVSILSGTTFYNKGTVTIDTLIGADGTSVFENMAGSTLIVNGEMLAAGTLDAGTCSNTVIYNSISPVSQTIKPTTYCNIIMNNDGLKSASVDFDANGDLTVNLGSNLTINNNVVIQVLGAATTAGQLNNDGHLQISD